MAHENPLDSPGGDRHKWEKVVISGNKWDTVPKLFVSSFSRSLDAKGRLMLPPEYREGLEAGALAGGTGSGSFWLTGFYGRLVAYLPQNWEEIVEQLNKISFSSKPLSHFKSKIIGLAQELTPDQQGRVRIPQPLMREAGLVKDVLLVGLYGRFEIWDQKRYDELMIDEESVAAELANTGLTIPLG